ncbi:hypothetical protein J437_LFUL012175 [Ladona fulva]|uniref:C2H2-type domain-containing protein n=1 Tax=Ladona fulva TaxID=123851 RepID=A0A8K0KD64_LADFU|nr:hypothetical protein J437_LFUL012175 [Ladona fulva]
MKLAFVEQMYPDDELPEFICCDCIEEVMEIENLSEACQAALKYLVCRTRLLKHLEYLQEKKRFTESPSNLTLKKFISEDRSALADAVPEESRKYSFPLLSKNKLQTFHQGENFQIGSESGIEFNINKEINLSSCVYHCRFCSGVFLNKEELNRHEYLFHNAHEGFPCGKCHKIFKTLKSLERHIEKRNFRCKYQGCVTAKQSIKDPSMNYCIQSPSAPTILEKEESNRAELKDYLKFCGKALSTKKVLREHMVTHSLVKKFECHICHMGFRRGLDRCAKWKHEKMVHKVCKRKERHIIEEKTLEEALLRDTFKRAQATYAVKMNALIGFLKLAWVYKSSCLNTKKFCLTNEGKESRKTILVSSVQN